MTERHSKAEVQSGGGIRRAVVLGTGGIGTGVFFAVEGNATLGREESRSGRYLDRRDYCKLHIVSDVIARLVEGAVRVVPIGRVGNDMAGERLLEEMRLVGLDTRYVTVTPGAPTLSSFCVIYPDGSGGNLTTSDSASGQVTDKDIEAVESEFALAGSAGIALAVPEVPWLARRRLLELGTRYGLFRAAAFLSGETYLLTEANGAALVDLLALNVDEAARAADLSPASPPPTILEALVNRLQPIQPDLMISMTVGSRGAWFWDSRQMHHRPACAVNVVNTAGAGDAHLGGMLAGLALGLESIAAFELGVLAAAVSVTSQHTIHPTLTRTALQEAVAAAEWRPAPEVLELVGRR